MAGLAAALWALWAPAASAGPFSDWAAVVVAGDWRGSEGGPTQAFDNARRDVATALQATGFPAERLRQFSTRPGQDRQTRPQRADARLIYQTLGQLTAEHPGGCLLYMSTHGSPQGVVIGEQIVPPEAMAEILDRTCGERPTVVVISACFSGVFVPQLATPNRMVLTAARRDRTSFGCGQADRYPYFDECFLGEIGRAANFAALADQVRQCVAARETKEGAKPASEPQLFVGAALRPFLPLWSLHN
ncbi:MAG: C13 family peptidase [Phenylobacterium sp.]